MEERLKKLGPEHNEEAIKEVKRQIPLVVIKNRF
jgi:hypothetical protein